MLAKLMKMQVLEDDDDDIGDGESEDDSKRMSDGRPAWMRTLHTSVRTWLDLVPRVSSNIKIYSKTCLKQALKKKTKNWFSRPIIA